MWMYMRIPTLRTLVRKLHRVQEPIREHNVRVISISINDGFANSSLRTTSICFLTSTKDVHSSVGTIFICSFPDPQDVEAVQGPFANKMFASVYATLYEPVCGNFFLKFLKFFQKPHSAYIFINCTNLSKFVKFLKIVFDTYLNFIKLSNISKIFWMASTKFKVFCICKIYTNSFRIYPSF